MDAINDSLRRLFFRYDHDLPLEAAVTAERVEAGLLVQRVHFSSIHAERVPALVVAPPADGARHAALVIGHGAGGHKDEERMQPLFRAWARSGFVCIASDAPFHGERGPFPFALETLLQRPFSGLDFVVQNTVDLMRSVDYLETRPDVDGTRLGFAGFSMSAVLGVHFVALDERIRVASLAIGGAGLLHFLAGRVPPEQRADAELVATLMDPMHYAPMIAPRPVLMVNALQDTLIPPVLGHILFNALREPKQIIWYTGPHGEIPHPELERVHGFLAEQLRPNHEQRS